MRKIPVFPIIMAAIIIMVTIFLYYAAEIGFAEESTMTKVVLENYPGARIIKKTEETSGKYIICHKGKIIIIKTNRALVPRWGVELTLGKKEGISCQS